MKRNTISAGEARKLIIRSQLLSNSASLKSKSGLLKIIETIGYVQIDTISVVERSHHHILWTRMPGYKRNMLDVLLEKDKSIFEYWSHAAAYLPMKDFRFSLIRKNFYSKKYKSWGKANRKMIKYVYDRIKAEGALQSKDFEDKRSSSSGWWDWKPSKDALDYLFHNGELMIAARKGFQKVYDLTERILPDNVNINFPTDSEFYEHLILTAIRSSGISSPKEIIYQRSHEAKAFREAIERMLEEDKILKVHINGKDGEFYTTIDKLNMIGEKKYYSGIHILSPFDNLVIQRKRLKELFGFDYTIECYLPEAKRKFGYFCMPVLFGDKFIGRIDAKADRAKQTFIIRNIFREERAGSIVKNSVTEKISGLAEFCGCKDISEIPGMDSFITRTN